MTLLVYRKFFPNCAWRGLLEDHRWSAAPLLAAVGVGQLDPVNVADGHWPSASHWSIMAQASSLVCSH
jgi:hypothetical protein